MKRAREEAQFGGRTGPSTSANRILGTTQTNQGTTVQYQIPPNVLRTGGGTNDSTVMGQGPTVQYQTTYASSPITGNNIPRSVTPSQVSGGPPPPQHLSVNTTVNATNQLRHKGGQTVSGGPTGITPQFVGTSPGAPPPPVGPAQFQRLKVEDALSYLDKVKFKFEKQPQVYNDFLDIMKEFKSQAIDTPGVIQRVSTLFNGHPELIVGFNTFLPPGYKIEVQANDQGFAYQVSVSLPPTTTGGLAQPSPPTSRSIHMIHTGAVNLMTHQTTLPPTLHSSPHQTPSMPTSTTTMPAQSFSRERTISGSGGSAGNLSNLGGGNGSQSVTPNSSGGPTSLNSSSIRSCEMNEVHNLHHLTHPSVLPTDVGGVVGGGASNTQNQPVEFNHAISYVNKIKNRFQHQPEKYKKFLEILHTYQKEQKIVKEVGSTAASPSKVLTEAEVYNKVAKLFDKDEDLLREFGQFLPDATSHTGYHLTKPHIYNEHKKLTSVTAGPHQNIKSFNNSQNNVSRTERDFHPANEKEFHPREKERNHIAGPKYGHNSAQVKKSPSYNPIIPSHIPREREGPPPPKRHKPICRDVTLAEASKFGSLRDYAFFDKVREALRSPEVYDNFLRCLTLFNQEIISKSELLNLVSPFLSKFPDLHRWFQDFIGPSTVPETVPMASAQQRQDRTQSELAQEIDLSSCKRLGASYCALPKTSEQKKCSGRTALCREVLNDTWVSFPTWAEDSTFVTSRKTQYEEIIYRCEDERFELDGVIETNSATIRVLEGVQKRMSRMSPEEVSKFRLDDCLGGTSATIHQRAVKRIYGEKAADVIQGLKKNPVVAVPVVLRRLKAKEEEWREAQKGFNKTWREQNEKYYLKSLDHQGITFKQNDIKSLRSKSLFNEIETLYDERHEQNDEGSSEQMSGPHLILSYKDKTILEDAANLLIHHVKRQTGIQKQEKTKIKTILRQFVPDIFFAPRQQLSDDERDEEDKDMDVDNSDNESKANTASGSKSCTNASASGNNASNGNNNNNISSSNTNKQKNEDNKESLASSNLPATSMATTAIASSSVSTTSTFGDMAIKSESSGVESNIQNDLCNPSSSNNNINNNPNSMLSVDGNIKNSTTSIDIKLEKDDNVVSSSNLPPHAVSKYTEEAYTLYFANNSWYLFLRLHAILCDRLKTMYDRAQALALEEAKHRTNRRESTATALRLKPKSEIQIEDYYPTFLDMLKNVLDGNMEANNYEDSLREMFGIHAYIAFTLDRVVSNAVRQLQHCVTERGAIECVELFHQEQKKNGAGGLCKTAMKRSSAEFAYQKKAEASLQDENCFKVYIYKIDCRVTIELLDTESDDTEKSVANQQTWSNYTERYANPATAPSITTSNNRSGGNENVNSSNKVEIKSEKDDDLITCPRKPLFLPRNIRCFNTKNNQVLSSLDVGEPIVIDGDNLSSITLTSKEESRIDFSITSTSTTSSTIPTTTTTSAGSGPNRLHNREEVLLKNVAPERMGATDNIYIMDPKQEVKLNLNSYKMVFVMNKNDLFYKRNSIYRARITHPNVTKSRQMKFQQFIQKWLDKNVSESNKVQCSDWLMGRSADLIPNITTVLQDNDVKKTPYTIYNRYKVEKLNRDS